MVMNKQQSDADARNIRSGNSIPSENYCDQPYVVINKQGEWVCLLTTGHGKEGQPGQHIVACNSSDNGMTWSAPVDVESSRDVESAYATPYITPSGRIYAFYNYNGDNFRAGRRSDELGWYVFRFSDNGGYSWSDKRYRVPMRMTQVDRENEFQGNVQLFWSIAKPVVKDDILYIPYSKNGNCNPVKDNNEGWILVSDNIAFEEDPDKIRWQLRPEGDVGIKNPSFSSVQEEHNMVLLNNGDFLCVYRTTMGYAAQSTSSDNAKTWTDPILMPYSPAGKAMKTPRACPMIWKTSTGNYLFWYHNNSTKHFSDIRNRNPVWISGGVEREGKVYWSQPEILLYSEVKSEGMSYPDLIERDGEYWITHTNKIHTWINKIDPQLLEGMFRQGEASYVPQEGLIVHEQNPGAAVNVPKLPAFFTGGGITISMKVRMKDLAAGQILFDTRNAEGKGIVISITDRGTVKLEMTGLNQCLAWDTDAGKVKADRVHRITFIADGAAKVLSVVVDDELCDGGAAREYGWCRISEDLNEVNGLEQSQVGPAFNGDVLSIQIYNRYLRTSEAIALYRAL